MRAQLKVRKVIGMKPNIILITADQMRGDCIEALGHPDVKTPNLNTMINHGAAFTNAYSATATCIPARAALFTGLSQKTHKRVGYEDFVDWNYESTIASVFSNAGYHTQCAGKMHVWPPRKLMGFHDVKLFDGFLPHRNTNSPANMWWNRACDYTQFLQREIGHAADFNDAGIGANSWVARPWPYSEHTHPTNWTVTESIDFLRRRDTTKPFFLYTSFLAPHQPLLPPAHYLDMYLNKDLAKPIIGSWVDESKAKEHPDADCYSGKLQDDDMKRFRAGYYAMITHMDHQIGRLLRALTDERLLNNTIILFTSDHGEMLGEHNQFRKCQPFNGSVKVPMIVYDPGNNLNFEHGKKSTSIAELRDVLPTLTDAANIDCPGCVEGTSLIKTLCSNCKTREFLHGEHTAMYDANLSAHYIVSENYKYIWYSDTGKEMLFNLEVDENECYDLACDNSYLKVLQKYRNLLIKELAGRPEGYSNGKKLIAGRTPVNILN